MARLSYSKASLQKHGADLKRYLQYLPSLDLKRQQLLAERIKASAQLAELEREVADCAAFVDRNLPMLASTPLELGDLVTVAHCEIGRENVAGVNLPVLQDLQLKVKDYSTYCLPHWVDQTAAQMARMLDLKMRQRVCERRVAVLEKAVKKVNQRVNLFDKVLIPRARQNIRKIRIFLSDAERAGVVRAKLTKSKQAG